MNDSTKWNGLRRTAIKRKPSKNQKPRKPIQRSTKRIRSRSKTRSRKNPHLNESLRRQYLEEQPLCQTCRYIHGHASRHIHEAVEPHHIWAGSPKVDRYANLIAVCRRCHNWLHDGRHINDGKIICLFAKLQLGDRHWNVSELSLAARQGVGCWIARPDKQPQLAWVREWYWSEVVRAIEQAGQSTE